MEVPTIGPHTIWVQYANIEEATSLAYHIWIMVCGPYVVTLLN